MSDIITDIGFDSKSLWQAKGFEPHPFPESTWPLFKDLQLKSLTSVEGEDLMPVQEMIRRPMCEGTFRHFHNEKIEKLALMWVLISKSIAGGSWVGWPTDAHDFPALIIAWEESRKRLHIIIDLMPTVDVVEHEWYREKYLDGIEPVFNEYKDLIGPPSTYRWFQSGKRYSTPINVAQDGDTFTAVSLRSRNWWRNLRGGRQAKLRVSGRQYTVRGEVLEDHGSVVDGLAQYFKQNPGYAKYFDVRLAPDGQPSSEDPDQAAAERVMIRLSSVTSA